MASGEESCPPEQNAEAVMPTVWAMRIAAGRGAIATRFNNKLVDVEFMSLGFEVLRLPA